MTPLTPREQALYDALRLCRDVVAADAATLREMCTPAKGAMSDGDKAMLAEMDQLVITAGNALAMCEPDIPAEQLQAATELLYASALATWHTPDAPARAD